MLGDPLADLAAGDQEHPVGPLERGAQARRVGVVGDGGAHAEGVGQLGEALGVAAGGDDLVGGGAPLQEGLDDEAAEVAGGSGDDDGHVVRPFGGRPAGGGGGGGVGVARANLVGRGLLPHG